jgi:hypothetical protein
MKTDDVTAQLLYGVAHVRALDSDCEAWCGANIFMTFALVDEDHARACIQRGTRLQPCDGCMRELEAWRRIVLGED